MLRRCLIELRLRLGHLILQVLPANVCQGEAPLGIIPDSDVASATIGSPYLSHICNVSGRMEHEVHLRIGNDGRRVSQSLTAHLRGRCSREPHGCRGL